MKPLNEKSLGIDELKKNEMLYYGVHTCQSLFRHRRTAIVRAYCTEERLRDFSSMLKWCSQEKKAYHVVSKEDLAKIADSVHHEGVCILARKKPDLGEQDLLTELKKEKSPLVIVDGVQNPHNVGSIMRAMGHFGWKHMIFPSALKFKLTPSAARMSEGGCELVSTYEFKNDKAFIDNLKALGFTLYGTSSHAKKSLFTEKLPPKSIAYVFGNEISGVSESMSKLIDEMLIIPGTGGVKSLNVAMACALSIAEHTRQHGSK